MAKLKDQKKSVPASVVKKWKGGRPPSSEEEKRSYYYGFRLSEQENIEFENLFVKSGAMTRSDFIKGCVFDKPFKVITTDKSALDICIKLNETNAEIRKIGVNYNQVTKAILTAFTEKKALAFLYKLEKATIDISKLLQQVILISEEYKKKWLPK